MKVLIVVLFLCSLLLPVRAELNVAIPLDVENVFTARISRFENAWYLVKNGAIIVDPATKNRWNNSAPLYHRNLKECLLYIEKKGYMIVKLFKDAIDDDYFICVKSIKR